MKIETMIDAIKNYHGKKIKIMEVCGTHTHEIFRQGIRQLLPKQIELISGPGCPVCVTESNYIDEAIYLAVKKHCHLFTFGDLMRVPGNKQCLLDIKREGYLVDIVYSPIDCLDYVKNHPEEECIFLSIGFETTTPASLITLKQAINHQYTNFSLLTANKTMKQAYLLMKDSCDAFLYPGHVHAITGYQDCLDLLKLGQSGVISGFEANDILQAIYMIMTHLDKPYFNNAYTRIVHEEGNKQALKMINTYMEKSDDSWRGLGIIKDSGLKLRKEFEDYDARIKFQIPHFESYYAKNCRCSDILQGKIKPHECPLFEKACTRDHPLGACMVSSEGTCSAYSLYGGEIK